jgi:hypothetical protein
MIAFDYVFVVFVIGVVVFVIDSRGFCNRSVVVFVIDSRGFCNRSVVVFVIDSRGFCNRWALYQSIIQ